MSKAKDLLKKLENSIPNGKLGLVFKGDNKVFLGLFDENGNITKFKNIVLNLKVYASIKPNQFSVVDFVKNDDGSFNLSDLATLNIKNHSGGGNLIPDMLKEFDFPSEESKRMFQNIYNDITSGSRN